MKQELKKKLNIYLGLLTLIASLSVSSHVINPDNKAKNTIQFHFYWDLMSSKELMTHLQNNFLEKNSHVIYECRIILDRIIENNIEEMSRIRK